MRISRITGEAATLLQVARDLSERRAELIAAGEEHLPPVIDGTNHAALAGIVAELGKAEFTKG
jgi:hypothetical protein